MKASSQATIDAVVQSVCDESVVLLGELPSHGEGETFLLKSRIVRRLVERCGFGTLVFEAGAYDFIGFRRALATGEATRADLDGAIGGFWLTSELGDWRGWLFERARAGELLLAGMDDQPSATASYAKRALPGLVAAHQPASARQESPAEPDPDLAADCRVRIDRHLRWRYGDDHPFDEAARTSLVTCVDRAAAAAPDDDDGFMLRLLARYLSRPQGGRPPSARRAASTHGRTWVAMPDSFIRKFSASRSPSSKTASGAWISATRVPRKASSPSSVSAVYRTSTPRRDATWRNTSRAAR